MRQTKFSGWVRDYGVTKLHEALGKEGCAVTKGLVYQWLRGDCEPRGKKIRALVRIGGGKISTDDIFAHFSGDHDHAAAGRHSISTR